VESPVVIAYPNPVKNEMHVKFPPECQNQLVRYELFTTNVQLLENHNLKMGLTEYAVNTQGWIRGMYIIRATCGGQSLQQTYSEKLDCAGLDFQLVNSYF
jgi:hypothetical protein